MAAQARLDHLTLEPTKPVSADGYLVIAADLEQRIADGEFPIGGRLPSEATLALAYGVSRARIRSAVAALARRGLVVSHRGAGWIVQSQHQVQGMDRMRTFTQWAEEHGRTTGGTVVSRLRGPADGREARVLGLGVGQPVLRLVRVRTLDARVVMVERSSWARWVEDIVDALPDDVVSTTRALADEGIRVVAGDHRIEAVAASSEDARLLGVRRSSPLLQVGRTTSTREGRVVELGVDRYVQNVIAFEITAGETVRTPL